MLNICHSAAARVWPHQGKVPFAVKLMMTAPMTIVCVRVGGGGGTMHQTSIRGTAQAACEKCISSGVFFGAGRRGG